MRLDYGKRGLGRSKLDYGSRGLEARRKLKIREPEPNRTGGQMQLGGPIVVRPFQLNATNRFENPVEATATAYSAFFRVYQDSGNWMLQGGQVAGGNGGNEDVADITIGTVGSEPSDGTHYWLEITGDGEVDAGVLLPGFEVTAVTTGSGSSLPANTLPTAASHTSKKFYLLLGTWNNNEFAPSQIGNVIVGYCPGNYDIGRG